MKTKKYIVLAVSALFLFGLLILPVSQTSVPNALAQSSFNTYLTIDGVQGSSGQGSGSIDVLSWSWGATQTGTYSSGSGAGSGKVSVQDLSFTKRLDKSSPMLYQLSKGKKSKSAVFSVYDERGDLLKIEMSDVSVKSYGVSGSQDQPTEFVTINFAKMTVSYDLKSAKK